LASLLVLAAALTGIAAPLYPVLYAADKPERAIYARGTGVVIYVIAFFIFSFTIGKMAPGWAALLANAFAVIFLVIPSLNLIGDSSAKIWGMPISKWQERAFKKAGTAQTSSAKMVHFSVNWVLSSALAKAFVERDNTALISEGMSLTMDIIKRFERKSLPMRLILMRHLLLIL